MISSMLAAGQSGMVQTMFVEVELSSEQTRPPQTVTVGGVLPLPKPRPAIVNMVFGASVVDGETLSRTGVTDESKVNLHGEYPVSNGMR